MNWDAYLVMGVSRGDPTQGYRLAAIVAESDAKAIELFTRRFPDCEVATFPSFTQMRASCDMLQTVLDRGTLTDAQMEHLNAVIYQSRQ